MSPYPPEIAQRSTDKIINGYLQPTTSAAAVRAKWRHHPGVVGGAQQSARGQSGKVFKGGISTIAVGEYWLHHPCPLWGPQSSRCGGEIINGYLKHPVSGAPVGGKWLHHPCPLKGTQRSPCNLDHRWLGDKNRNGQLTLGISVIRKTQHGN